MEKEEIIKKAQNLKLQCKHCEYLSYVRNLTSEQFEVICLKKEKYNIISKISLPKDIRIGGVYSRNDLVVDYLFRLALSKLNVTQKFKNCPLSNLDKMSLMLGSPLNKYKLTKKEEKYGIMSCLW